jgi:hypothetical protein
MSRSGGLAVAAGVLVLAAAGVLGGAKYYGIDLLSMRPSERELVVQMSEAAALSGGYAMLFSGPDAEKWKVAPGHQLEKFSVESGDAAFARLTSSAPLDTKTWEWSTQGLSIMLPVEFNNQTNGKKVEIGIVARATAVKSTDSISVAYATQQAGNSGWKKIPVSRDFELFKFVFAVPALEPGSYTHQPILVVHADASGSGRSAEILGVYVKNYQPELPQ